VADDGRIIIGTTKTLGVSCLAMLPRKNIIRSYVLSLLAHISLVSAFDTVSWADYPGYCAKNVADNVIHPLPSGYSLQQVQIAMRHGARTLASRSTCWRGYNVTWHCNARNQVVRLRVFHFR
jgi:hypothetical protein